MDVVFDDVLPWVDPVNVLEQVGNIYGVSEEDRNNSRLERLVTSKGRPFSHSATETAAWIGGNIVPEVASGVIKGVKSYRQLMRALDSADAISMLNKGVRSAGDAKVVKALAEVGNKVTSDGVNAAKTAKAGKVIKNTPKIAWRANKANAENVLDAAKGAKAISEVIPTADARFADESARLRKLLQEGRKKISGDAYSNFAQGIYDDMSAARDTAFDFASQEHAIQEGFKTAAMTGALNRALSSSKDVHQATKPIKDSKPTYTKPVITGTTEERMMKVALNMYLNVYDFGTMVDKWPMKRVDALVSQINKDDYFDQSEIDSLIDVEKIWFIKDIMKGKFNDENHNKTLELVSTYNDLFKTNKDEDKK